MRLHGTVTRIRACVGFTVLELLLAVSIMTVIVIGLYTVFDQTQKALRGTISQVDVLEGIRATSDLVGRELEGVSYLALPRYTNFYVARNPLTESVPIVGLSQNALLTTVIQDVFFHTRVGERWTAIGFWVGPLRTNANLTAPISVGRLYRFSTNITEGQIRGMAAPNNNAAQRNALLTAFHSNQRIPLSAPILDGVVHFRIIAYDESGVPLYPATNQFSQNYLDLLDAQFDQLRNTFVLAADSTFAATIEAGPGQSMQYLFSDLSFPSHPGAIDVELGVLEPQVVRQYESIAEVQPLEAAKFLSRHAGQIHLFRQRIPLRNAPKY